MSRLPLLFPLALIAWAPAASTDTAADEQAIRASFVQDWPSMGSLARGPASIHVGGDWAIESDTLAPAAASK